MKYRPWLFLLTSLVLVAAPLRAQNEELPLFGVVEEPYYIAPGGHYRIEIPVLGELGGTVRDTANIATFRDAFSTHVVIACLPMTEELRAELTKLGRKDFLTWFFANHIQPEFKKAAPGATAESAKYLSSVEDGAVLVMSLLPGGTAFGDRLFLKDGETAPVAKRGSLVFLRGDRLFVLTTEFAERSLDHRSYRKSVDEEDALLRKRLLDLLGKITFRSEAPITAGAPPAK
jgi:hypothetical protein